MRFTRINPQLKKSELDVINFKVDGFKEIPIHLVKSDDGGIQELRVYDPNNVIKSVEHNVSLYLEINRRLYNEGYEIIYSGDIFATDGKKFKPESQLICFLDVPYHTHEINPPAPIDILTKVQQEELIF